MDADAVLGTELWGLRRRRPEVAGTVLAGTDGLLISSDLPTTDATHLAALAAASFGLGNRVADTVRHGEFQETMVRTARGCVVTYPAGRHALLTLITAAGADLETLHAEAREVADRTGSVFDRQRTAVAPGPVPVPDPHAPLAMRTPMATLPGRAPNASRVTGWRRPPI
ncbi:roadblock/LC7 domain-containing protein [Micromonospora rubida]|uniref:roadblock/LC7 domain-containing protein n=1 Tax=Micromonospora rubida TaxID=2697657 RepID=UPI002E2E2411|nr:roadblock/LC7 domain-containing protein [Micromonospora rubida]